MTLDVLAEEEAVESFHYFLEESRAVRRNVENYHQGEDSEGELDAVKGKGDGNQGENDGRQGANGAAADFSLGNFGVFYMLGKKDISPHPVQREPD